MSVRICLRVRERRDIDLILDKGMLATGRHAHTLDAPGKFYLLADGHNQPRRARAYLVTDYDVRTTAARYSGQRPLLDALSQAAIYQDATITRPRDNASSLDPEQALTAALTTAHDQGLTIPELIKHTGMRRTWIYNQLQAFVADGRARKVSRGHWRA